MGNAASKAARKLPREKPTWAGIEPATRPRPLAFESKNEAIERDAKDPHLLEKLSRLGPVRIDHHMQTVRAANGVQNMHRSRMRSESEATMSAVSTDAATNRLLASSLAELLEERKSITDCAELETLAGRYHVDTATLERLARVVNTPSIDERMVVRVMDEHGEESLTMMASWVDPEPSRA